MNVLIVGASIAGLAAADALRASEYQGEIVVVDADPGLPYDKPPLSKAALKPDWDSAKALLRPADHFSRLGIELRSSTSAARLDGETRTVTLSSGEQVRADHVVIATGVRARRLPEAMMVPGVHSIRTAADSEAVRSALAARPRVVVVGAGFIGAEAAAVASDLALSVTVVEAADLPFARLFGSDVARAMAAWHGEAGVTLKTGVGVSGIEGTEQVRGVRLENGEVLPAELVILGLGASPQTDWLAGSGVKINDGVECDEHGRTNVPGIWSAGDAARWHDPVAGVPVRVEHWTTAKEQGAAVGFNIARPSEERRGVGPVPYFWSDQYGRRVQFLGRTHNFDGTHLVHGSLAEDSFVVLYSRAGTITGALGVNAARYLMPYRSAIEQRRRVAEVVSNALV